MDGQPLIPGYHFNDITKKDYHLSAQFRWKNGYAIPKDKSTGIGKALLDVDSILYSKSSIANSYNPELTYGRAKDPQRPIAQPHFILYDGKCLSFCGFTKQTVMESPVEKYRIRRVKITYYLVDDTISVTEPVLENAGYFQGCLLKRDRVPNPHRKNRFWHWSDFNNGVEVSFHGVTYRLCSCDRFTEQFLARQGVKLAPAEPVPEDPYLVDRRLQQQQQQQAAAAAAACGDDGRLVEELGLKKFLEFDGKVLRFYAVWEDTGSQPPVWKFFSILYFLVDDRVAVYETKDADQQSCDSNLFPLFLGKIKLPKDGSHLPTNFPSKVRNNEQLKYYEAKDFIIGNAISVLGRRFLLYDCDKFTRGYFKDVLEIDQPDPIKIVPIKYRPAVRKSVLPPYIGFGSPEDTRQNCLSLVPKPPRTLDFITYVLDATKKLRYKLKMDPVHEMDKHREFVMEFCLGNGQMSIVELAARNSGFTKGRFMSSVRLRKPGTDVDDDVFYGTKDFAIGALLHIRGSVFKIVELDLWTYNYMEENKHRFTQEAIDGAREFMGKKDLIKLQKDEEDVERSKLMNCSYNRSQSAKTEKN